MVYIMQSVPCALDVHAAARAHRTLTDPRRVAWLKTAGAAARPGWRGGGHPIPLSQAGLQRAVRHRDAVERPASLSWPVGARARSMLVRVRTLARLLARVRVL